MTWGKHYFDYQVVTSHNSPVVDLIESHWEGIKDIIRLVWWSTTSLQYGSRYQKAKTSQIAKFSNMTNLPLRIPASTAPWYPFTYPHFFDRSSLSWSATSYTYSQSSFYFPTSVLNNSLVTYICIIVCVWILGNIFLALRSGKLAWDNTIPTV